MQCQRSLEVPEDSATRSDAAQVAVLKESRLEEVKEEDISSMNNPLLVPAHGEREGLFVAEVMKKESPHILEETPSDA